MRTMTANSRRMTVNSIAFQILSAMTEISKSRKGDKQIYINSFSIAKATGLDWHTVDKYFKNNLFIKEI